MDVVGQVRRFAKTLSGEEEMATSRCAKCESRRFEMKEAEPETSKYKVMFIQCASCGAVVGVVDYYNVPSLLGKIGRKMGINIFGS